MKKITSNNLSKKLVKYGALSLAIAGVADASGQIVYTDVDPDFSGGLNDTYAIDLNNDGIDDFTIIQSASPGGVNGLMIFSAPSSNGAVGFNSGYNYPSNLSSGDPVSAGQTFVDSFGTFNFEGCAFANSQWCGGVVDGYMGVRFDISGSTHYGWIRMDMDAQALGFVVKDFAYEATPDTAIDAGDMGVAGVVDNNFTGFKYFAANNQLTLSANMPMDKVSLHNMLGQEVISKKLSNNTEIINLSELQSGVYLATVSIDGTRKTVKFVKD